TATAIVETTKPATDRIQNGRISRPRSPRPVRPQTQCRFARYDGAIPQPTATTLADPAGTPAPSARATSTAALSRVVPTETTRQRDILPTTALPRTARGDIPCVSIPRAEVIASR